MSASALSYPDPTSWQKEFEGGEKIFYMYACDWGDYCVCVESGLYYNTDPPENIYNFYYIDDGINVSHSVYFYEGQVYFSDDGMYFAAVSIGTLGLPLENKGSFVTSFYENGRQFKKYTVTDFTDADSSSFNVWPVFLVSEREFDSENNILSITIFDDTIYRFDITTGGIIETIEPEEENIAAQNFANTAVLLMIMIGLMSVVMLITRMNRRNLNRI